MAVRRRRVSIDQCDRLLSFVSLLPVEMVELTTGHIFGAMAKLAEREKLTLYDASYLYLASQDSLPLVSLDRSLCAAARRQGIEVLD
jgi:predicted nucleic acid-binding protein